MIGTVVLTWRHSYSGSFGVCPLLLNRGQCVYFLTHIHTQRHKHYFFYMHTYQHSSLQRHKKLNDSCQHSFLRVERGPWPAHKTV